MIYPILVYGHKALRQPTKEITQGTDLSTLIKDMYETMYLAGGVGLAAPQIGKPLRLFIIDNQGIEDDPDKAIKKVFVNPTCVDQQGDPWTFEEGCLSIPHIREEVTRSSKITLRYFDENWNPAQQEYNGVTARIIQHEYDHLEGILFIDHLSSLKKKVLQGKLNDMTKGKIQTTYPIIGSFKKHGK